MFEELVAFRDEVQKTIGPALAAYNDLRRAFEGFDGDFHQVECMRNQGAAESEVQVHISEMKQKLRDAVEEFKKVTAAP